MRPVFPFSAIVGQDEMKLSLIVAAIDPTIGGVLVFGDRGTGKSTAVRGLAGLLPPMRAVVGCPYHCDPDGGSDLCDECRTSRVSGMKAGKAKAKATAKAKGKNGKGSAKTGPKSRRMPVPVVDLPLGATEDRIVGALDLERALGEGVKAFEPGLLARAHRGFLYIDEVNLLEDHLVDLLLDVAASGENVVEREGLSIRHPARFVLIGSGNPEEGELRPQLLDRFGLSVEISTPREITLRVEVVRQREAFEQDPAGFLERYEGKQRALRRRLVSARKRLTSIRVDDPIREQVARLCLDLGTDGLRGELVLMRAARALAAFDGEDTVRSEHLRRMAPPALRHRLRRNPLDESGSGTRVERALAELFGA